MNFQSKADIYKSPREPLKEKQTGSGNQLLGFTRKSEKQSQAPSILYLPGCGQVVRTIQTWKAPEDVLPKGTEVFVIPALKINIGHLLYNN